MSIKWARGFENYRWQRNWSARTNLEEYEYIHANLNIVIVVYENKITWDESKLEYKLFDKGVSIIRSVSNKKQIEENLEDVFKEMVTKEENKKVLFNGIFI